MIEVLTVNQEQAQLSEEILGLLAESAKKGFISAKDRDYDYYIVDTMLRIHRNDDEARKFNILTSEAQSKNYRYLMIVKNIEHAQNEEITVSREDRKLEQEDHGENEEGLS